jgi:transposase
MRRRPTHSAEEKARERARVILQVRCGQMTAKQGAQSLGISRKTYYQWEKRALGGMMAQLQQQKPGRPRKKTHRQLEAMTRKIARLEARLKAAEQTAKLRAILIEMRRPEANPTPKKKRSTSPGSST